MVQRPALWIALIAPRGAGKTPAQEYAGERGRWLSLWSATPWRYQRVGSDVDIRLYRPVLSVCGGIQPPLHHLLGGEEDGLRPRWLPHLAMLGETPEMLGQDGPVTAWDDAIAELYDTRELRTWTLDSAGLGAWQSARIRWRRDSGGAESASVSAALAKADMQAARIALVLAESMGVGHGGSVPEDAVIAAIAITDYVIGCWRALPDREALTTSRRDETLRRGVGQLADWLEQHGGRASRRVLQKACVAGARTDTNRAALEQAMEDLPVKPVRLDRAQGGRGRHGSSLLPYQGGSGRPRGRGAAAKRSGHYAAVSLVPVVQHQVDADGQLTGPFHENKTCLAGAYGLQCPCWGGLQLVPACLAWSAAARGRR
jgi:hypothetical protein